MTRELPNTAVSFLYGKPPFSTFGESNKANKSLDNQHLMLTHNITPELFPNEPERIQSFDAAIERASVEKGPLKIGCKERLEYLNDPKTKKRLARRRQIYETGIPDTAGTPEYVTSS